MLEMGDKFYPRNFHGDTKDLEKMERFEVWAAISEKTK